MLDEPFGTDAARSQPRFEYGQRTRNVERGQQRDDADGEQVREAEAAFAHPFPMEPGAKPNRGEPADDERYDERMQDENGIGHGGHGGHGAALAHRRMEGGQYGTAFARPGLVA